MAERSTIEWTEATWNPVTGCTKVSPGCKHCYAETFAERWRGIPEHPYEQGFDLRLWPSRLSLPLEWTRPRRIFVNSMSDLFHKDVPDNYVDKVFRVMLSARQHIFQVLTKRSERLRDWVTRFMATNRQSLGRRTPGHIWLGVSVENQDYVSRVDHLKAAPIGVRFLSVEPLLGPVTLSRSRLRGIHWVIVGGESGPQARRMNPKWARDVKIACKRAKVAFFFKQWGAFNREGARVGKGAAGRVLDGKTWNEMPVEGKLLGRPDQPREKAVVVTR